jgi:thiol-disulfide isomerase/thioredoxin
MSGRFQRTLIDYPCYLFIFAMFVSSSISEAQTGSFAVEQSEKSYEASSFLNEVFESYSHASSYHIEAIEEMQIKGDYNRGWSKSMRTSIVANGSQYHFEANGELGSWVQISDGKTEWIYSAPLGQYIQQPTPGTGPGHIGSQKTPGIFSLIAAQDAAKSISGIQKLIRTAVFLPDQTIQINGDNISCIVIKATGELPATSSAITLSFRFWIDKQTKTIRKMTDNREGPLRPSEPDTYYTIEKEILFPVAKLQVKSFPESAFTFTPPMTASLVKEFESRMSLSVRQIVGKPAPAMNFKAADGKELSLKSFNGKPVLLDFWATWCAPCIESLPLIEKLHQETTNGRLVFLSIDEDAEAKSASEFWVKHKEPWVNVHGDSHILDKFPMHGIPYFVLIDANGNVAFSEVGFDVDKLRTALAALGTEAKQTSQPPSP